MHWIKYVNNYLINSLLLIIILSGCTIFDNTTSNIDNNNYDFRNTISYDEYGDKTSGILSVSPDKKGFIVTPSVVNKYNILISNYKDLLNIDIKKNDGIYKYDNKNYIIDNKYFEIFLNLNSLDKQLRKDNLHKFNKSDIK